MSQLPVARAAQRRLDMDERGVCFRTRAKKTVTLPA